MKNLLEYFYIFSKISTSFILMVALFSLGYFFYLGYNKQENVYRNQVEDNNKIQNSINQNFNKIQNISKKIEFNDQSLKKIENLLEDFSTDENNNKNNKAIEEMLNELKTNFQNLSIDVKKLNNKINEKNKNLAIPKNEISDFYNQKKDIIELILLKFENNLNFNNELNYLEKITNSDKSHIFEKLNIVINKQYKGNQFIENSFEEESNDYIRNKINKNSNKFISTFILPYINIKFSKENVLTDSELLIIRDIEKLIENQEYKKSYEKLQLINNFDIFYIETVKQLGIAIDFNNLLSEIKDSD